MADKVHIVGIDCAVDPRKTGIASGLFENRQLRILEVQKGTKKESVAKTVFDLCKGHETNLIAIDAPLGWPDQMGNCLANHNAGDSLDIEGHSLFRRETDRFIKRKIGKQPLDIGADRIARTAYAALKILNELSEIIQFRIPLAWSCEDLEKISVIEVYPAATLESHRIPNTGYKDKGKDPVKGKIVTSLHEHMVLPNDTDLILSDSDALDSVVCTLAAKDFLQGDSYQPEDKSCAVKEGWIWVRDIKK